MRMTLPFSPTQSERNWSDWRKVLKLSLRNDLHNRSMLTGMPLSGCHLHESIFPRRYLPKGVRWHYQIYTAVNSLLLSPEEHEHPPSREMAYWIACAYWGREIVEGWIASLPFKSAPDCPWRAMGPEILLEITRNYMVAKEMEEWYAECVVKLGEAQHAVRGILEVQGLQ